MSNYESEVERRAGADMVPFRESLEWNPERDDGSPILPQDSTSSCPTGLSHLGCRPIPSA